MYAPDQRHLLDRQPVLLVVPEHLKHELAAADERGIATLTLYSHEGWQRPLELARPERIVTVHAPPELVAELRMHGYTVQQEEPESPRKASR